MGTRPVGVMGSLTRSTPWWKNTSGEGRIEPPGGPTPKLPAALRLATPTGLMNVMPLGKSSKEWTGLAPGVQTLCTVLPTRLGHRVTHRVTWLDGHRFPPSTVTLHLIHGRPMVQEQDLHHHVAMLRWMCCMMSLADGLRDFGIEGCVIMCK